jgi:hypothetical protein
MRGDSVIGVSSLRREREPIPSHDCERRERDEVPVPTPRGHLHWFRHGGLSTADARDFNDRDIAQPGE